jgi:hypothetical protein
MPHDASNSAIELQYTAPTFFFWLAWMSGIAGLISATPLIGGMKRLWPAPLVALSRRALWLRRTVWIAFAALVLVLFTDHVLDRYKGACPRLVRSGPEPYVLVEHRREYTVDAAAFRRRMWTYPIFLALFFTPHGLIALGVVLSLPRSLQSSTRP